MDDDSDEVIGTQKITTGYGVIDAGWYSYTVNTSGYYTLKELDADETGTAVGITTDGDTSAVKFTTSDSKTVTRYANSSTELVYVDSGATYTGYTNFPSKSYDSDDGVSVLYVTSGANSTRLTNIYVVGTGSTSVDVTFAMFAGPSEASSTSGEFAYSTRLAWSQSRAPDSHASSSATTWSICTLALVARPRTKWMV